MANYSKDLVAASSIPIILTVLQQGESYGYEIIRKIKEASGGELEFAEGTLYPILKKMEEKKLLHSSWKTSESDRKRKYYKLTSEGKTQLKLEINQWISINSILEKLWKISTPNVRMQ